MRPTTPSRSAVPPPPSTASSAASVAAPQRGVVLASLSDGSGAFPPAVLVSRPGRGVRPAVLAIDPAQGPTPATGDEIAFTAALVMDGDSVVPDVLVAERPLTVERRLARLVSSGMAFDGAAADLDLAAATVAAAEPAPAPDAHPAIAWATAYFAEARRAIGNRNPLLYYADPRLPESGQLVRIPELPGEERRGPPLSVDGLVNADPGLEAAHLSAKGISLIRFENPLRAGYQSDHAYACAEPLLFLPKDAQSRRFRQRFTIAHETAHGFETKFIATITASDRPPGPAAGAPELSAGELFADASALLACAAAGEARADLERVRDLRVAAWLFDGGTHATGDACQAALDALDAGAPTDAPGVLREAAAIATRVMREERLGRQEILDEVAVAFGLRPSSPTACALRLVKDPAAGKAAVRAAADRLEGSAGARGLVREADGWRRPGLPWRFDYHASARRLCDAIDATARRFWTPAALRDPAVRERALAAWETGLTAECEERCAQGTGHLVPETLARLARSCRETIATAQAIALRPGSLNALLHTVAQHQLAALERLMGREWANAPGSGVGGGVAMAAASERDHTVTGLLAQPPQARLAALRAAITAEADLARRLAAGNTADDPLAPCAARQARRTAAQALLIDPVAVEALGPTGAEAVKACLEPTALWDATGNIAYADGPARHGRLARALQDLGEMAEEIDGLALAVGRETFRERVRRMADGGARARDALRAEVQSRMAQAVKGPAGMPAGGDPVGAAVGPAWGIPRDAHGLPLPPARNPF